MHSNQRSRAVVARMAVFIALMGIASGTLPAQASASPDSLERKVRGQLRSFVTWLDENRARGYVGEIGWPDNFKGEAGEWNGLARGWFDVALEHDLWVSTWATGEWWDSYRLSMYENDSRTEPGVDTANSQADVLEDGAAVAGRTVGINVNGGEFGTPIGALESNFSNENPGAYNTRYHYDRQGTFDYLAERGVGHVRIPFRWERIQPRLGAPLDTAELERLRAVVQRADEAGLKSILDIHNYGAYYLEQGGRGVRTPIGSKKCTFADFADLWRRLSVAFGDDQRVLMYALMAEPNSLPRVGDLAPAKAWERASQRALTAVRKTGDDKLIAVPGYGWDALQVFMRNHPDGWIKDPANNFVYEVHHYWDHDYSGDYNRSYAEEVESARKAGW